MLNDSDGSDERLKVLKQGNKGRILEDAAFVFLVWLTFLW